MLQIEEKKFPENYLTSENIITKPSKEGLFEGVNNSLLI